MGLVGQEDKRFCTEWKQTFHKFNFFVNVILVCYVTFKHLKFGTFFKYPLLAVFMS
jgi:hypothetical protein